MMPTQHLPQQHRSRPSSCETASPGEKGRTESARRLCGLLILLLRLLVGLLRLIRLLRVRRSSWRAVVLLRRGVALRLGLVGLLVVGGSSGRVGRCICIV